MMNQILDKIEETTGEYLTGMPKSIRKKVGQFFTSKETAVYMASLFEIPADKRELSILDAGAGSGILAGAVIERLQGVASVEKIVLTCYETDENVLPVLEQNLQWVAEHSAVSIEYKIIAENYILSQQDNFNYTFESEKNPTKYDLVIGNPPYVKLFKDAPEAQAMSEVCHGAPNLYFLFASMGIFNLKENAELVYIIPRSWTSGAYFRLFRQYLLDNSVLEQVHLFVSRDKVFGQENVLQETMIIKLKKTLEKPQSVRMTTSLSGTDFTNITSLTVPYHQVVSGPEQYVYLVTSQKEIDLLERMGKWKLTLPQLGLKMKTGLTVDFRNQDVLRSEQEDTTVPLFYAQHLQGGKVVFPIGKEKEFIETSKSGLLQKNKNYLFVKRFTAKEEKRRLQSAVYLAKKYENYEVISTQNKLNFIDGLAELSECVVYGLYVLFNSSVYDEYYRILNGSTQVNSTEVNSMPMPPMSMIEEMGKKLIAMRDMSEHSCDSVLRSYL